MIRKRIIPCLDIRDGRTVKGIQFEGIRDAGDPVQLAASYARQGADELVFLDITATNEKRKTLVSLVKQVGKELDIPFTVGGGISSIADVEMLLEAGADKVSINSSAVMRPGLITELATRFGSQCIVVAIDSKQIDNSGRVYLNGGRTQTDWSTLDWAKEAVSRGCGELLVTSMDRDGAKSGFELELLGAITSAVNVPVIASGGAGTKKDFVDVFEKSKVDAALAASTFHYNQIGIQELKNYLKLAGIWTRN